jgi:glutathione S-transferase
MERAAVILWHIEVSHFSEKARWALDYKSVAHERRTPLPSLHIPLAAWLTRGRAFTLPILELEGRRIADSAAIIAALERRFPNPPLYPADDALRRHALELARWFDRELGPYSRRLVFYELTRDPELLAQAAARAAPDLAARLGRAAVPYSRAFTAVRYGAGSRRAAEEARAMILAALARLEAELGAEQYLIGGRFSVADLTAASLFYPLVRPPQAPDAVDAMPEPFERFRATLEGRRGYAWVGEMFRRHRRAPAWGAREQGTVGASALA